MAVLYRKYRPGTFADVAGQEHVKTTLAYEVSSGKLAHAYLFTGPRGVGKTTTARIFAKAVNCPSRKKGDAEPCAECPSCLEIAEGRNLDVVEIDAASHTGVDNVREHVIENSRFAPSKSAYKVFIIDEVHMLSSAAFNALLKTLEEPPAHVIFILATTELHKLPATVVSRCQRFDFRKIGREDLMARLKLLGKSEKIKVDDDVLEAVARHSEGCLRDAESLLTQLFSMGENHVTVATASLVMPVLSAEAVHELAACLVSKDAARSLVLWEQLSRSGADLTRVLNDVTEVCRQAALSMMKGGAHAIRIEPGEASVLLQRLLNAREEMKRTEIPELPFELMVMEWCAAAEGGRAKGQVQSAKNNDDDEPPTPRLDKPQTTKEPNPKENIQAPMMETAGSASLSEIRQRWSDILRKAQEKHHSMPYMLAAAELLSCENGTLLLGFQYALYRDRLNDLKHKQLLEQSIKEVLGASVSVSVTLVAQKVDGTVEAAPNIVVSPKASLPDGFAELVKEFGGTVG